MTGPVKVDAPQTLEPHQVSDSVTALVRSARKTDVDLRDLDAEKVEPVSVPHVLGIDGVDGAREAASAETYWASLSAQYDYANKPGKVANYLTGATGLSPKPVVDAQIASLADPLGLQPKMSEVVKSLAAMVGSRPETLALTSSTSDGLAKVIGGLELGSNDVILRSNGSHRALLDPLLDAEKRGAKLAVIDLFTEELLQNPTRANLLEAFKEAIDAHPNAKYLCLTHIMPDTGVVLPLTEICDYARSRGVKTIVDGAHAPGQIELDIASYGCDVYAGSLHKWLGGPKGTGFVHVDEALIPAIEGKSHLRGKDVSDSIEKLSPVGAGSGATLAGLNAAIERWSEIQPDATARIKQLTSHLASELEKIPGVSIMPANEEVRAGIIGFSAEGMSVEELGKALAARGFDVAGFGVSVRLFANLNTTLADAEALASAVKDISTAGAAT